MNDQPICSVFDEGYETSSEPGTPQYDDQPLTSSHNGFSSSIFTRHNPHPNRVKHITGTRALWLIITSRPTRVLKAVVWVPVFIVQDYGVLQYATCLTRVTLTTLATLYPFLLTTTIRPSCATTVNISHAPCLAQRQSMLMRPFCRSIL